MPLVPTGFRGWNWQRRWGATFSACSYVGADATASKRGLLRQYLEAVLGLAEDVRFFIGAGNDSHGGDCNVSMVVSEEGPEMGGLEVVDQSYGDCW